MTTPSEHAKNATVALHSVLRISPDQFDVEGAAAVIEDTIRNATRERESRARRQLKEAKAAAQERLKRLLRSSPAVIYSFKASGDFAPTFVSENISDVLGYAPAEYLEDPSFWRDRVHPDDLARVEDAIAKFFQNGVHTVEYRFRRKDGSYCWVNDEQHLIRGVDGKPLEIVGSWSDITARKAAEEAKAAAHARLSQLLTSSPAVIYSYKATGDFAPTFISENIRDWLGYEPREYLHHADFWRRHVHPDELAAVEAEFGQSVQERSPHGRVPVSQEGWHILLGQRRATVDPGRRRPADRGDRLLERRQRAQAGGRSRGGGPRSRRVPARPIAGGDLQPSKQQATMRRHSSAGTSRSCLGYEREEYLGSPEFWRSRVHPEDLARIEKGYARLFEEGHLSNEYRFRKKDGNYCWIGDELQLIRNTTGDPIEVIGAWNDITARKQLSEVLVAAQDRLVRLLSSSPAVIYSYKATGDFAPIFISENIKTVLGYEPQRILGERRFLAQPGSSRGLIAASSPDLRNSTGMGATRSNIGFARRMAHIAG